MNRNTLRMFVQLIRLTGIMMVIYGCQSESTQFAESEAYKGDIKVSLAHPSDPDNEEYMLIFAAPKLVDHILICEVAAGEECKHDMKSEQGYEKSFIAKKIYSKGDRKFFKPESNALLEDELELTLVAYNDSNKIIDKRYIVFNLMNSAAP